MDDVIVGGIVGVVGDVGDGGVVFGGEMDEFITAGDAGTDEVIINCSLACLTSSAETP